MNDSEKVEKYGYQPSGKKKPLAGGYQPSKEGPKNKKITPPPPPKKKRK